MPKIDTVCDYSEVNIDNGSINIPFYHEREAKTNLGIFKTVSGSVRTDKYCGYSWLRDKNGEIIHEKNREGKDEEVILHIAPRFGLDLNEMLQKISTDDEFFEYLGLDTQEPLIRFFQDEPLIENASVGEDYEQLIAVISFIALLERRTRAMLIRRMVQVEENVTGRVRGHIRLNKQISRNICQGHAERIYSVHSERSTDTVENRILLFALKKAEAYLHGMKTVDERVLRNVVLIKNRLTGVGGQMEQSYCTEDVDKVIRRLPNIYRNYIPVFEYAKLIIAETSVHMEACEGGIRIVPFAINAHMLYECYVRACIKEIIHEVSGETLKIEMLKYVRDKNNIPADGSYGTKAVVNGNGDGCYIKGHIVPDIVLKYTSNTGKTYYRVYDVKYKDAGRSYSGRDDRLQLLAYNLLYEVNDNTGFIMPNGKNEAGKLNTVGKETMYGAEIGIGTPFHKSNLEHFFS